MPTRRNFSVFPFTTGLNTRPVLQTVQYVTISSWAGHRISHLMVVANELKRERAWSSADIDANHQACRIDVAGAGGNHDDRLRCDEHVVGGHLEVECVHDAGGNDQRSRDPILFPAGGPPGERDTGDDQDEEYRTERPSPGVEPVREVDAG